jgi:hypothetical protein
MEWDILAGKLSFGVILGKVPLNQFLVFLYEVEFLSAGCVDSDRICGNRPNSCEIIQVCIYTGNLGLEIVGYGEWLPHHEFFNAQNAKGSCLGQTASF